MSLVGNLEDLGLGEILQIVSLSRKTGILTLRSRDREGVVVFRQGQVVRAASSTYQQSLGEVLIQKGVIDLALLRKALSLQQEQGFHERLGVIMVKHFGVSQDVIEEVVGEQIENVVFSLFAWAEGDFDFVVQEHIETVDGTRLDPLQFMLDQGLNPQFLAMEGTRILDEKRYAAEMGVAGDDYDSEDLDLAFDLVDGQTSAIKPVDVVKQPLVIVDDDGPTLQLVADGLRDAGFDVHALTKSEDTLIKVDMLYRGGERPTVLIDLIMPKMDGSGVLGGIELLELLHNNFKDINMVVMTDYHHADAEKKVRDLGHVFVTKPRRVEINNQQIVSDFLARITGDIRGVQAGVASPEWQERFNLGDELRIEMGDDDDVPISTESTESTEDSGSLSLLRGMLEELNNPDLQGGVLLLVLRFASEFLNRAIVFMYDGSIVTGAGQFGIMSSATSSGDEKVRSINFSLDADSMFRDVCRSGKDLTCKPVPSVLDSRIFEQLGGGIPEEFFIGPLTSQSRVIGFLYGDNLPEKRPVGSLEPLSIFLSQAGFAMEKTMLERQLNERVPS